MKVKAIRRPRGSRKHGTPPSLREVSFREEKSTSHINTLKRRASRSNELLGALWMLGEIVYVYGRRRPERSLIVRNQEKPRVASYSEYNSYNSRATVRKHSCHRTLSSWLQKMGNETHLILPHTRGSRTPKYTKTNWACRMLRKRRKPWGIGVHKHPSCEDASDRQPMPIAYTRGCDIVKFGSLSGTSTQPRSASIESHT